MEEKHPSNTCQIELSQWAESMGFMLPNGKLASLSFYLLLTSTPNQRALWNRIFSIVKDRRHVRIAKYSESTRCPFSAIKHIINRKINENQNLFQTIDTNLAAVQERIKRIQAAEKATRDLEMKIILLSAAKNRFKSETTKYNLMQESLISSQGKENNEYSLNLWKMLGTSVRKNWLDPGIMQEILVFLQKQKDYSPNLWMELISDCQNELKAIGLAELNSLKMLEEIQKELPTKEMVAEMELKCARTDSILLLLKGQLLRKSMGALCPNWKDILREAQRLIIHADDNSIDVNDNELANLRQKVSDNLMKLYLAEKDVCLRRQKFLASIEEVADKRCKVGNLAADLTTSIHSDAVTWRNLIEKRQHFVQEHSSLIKRCPIEKLRLNDSKLKDPHVFPDSTDEEFKSVSFNKILQHILPEIHQIGQSVKELCFKWERSTLSTELDLKECIRKFKKLQHDISSLRGAIEVCKDQTFSQMIPTSYSVNDMNFKEWCMQASLWDLPAHQVNESTMSSYDF